MLIVGCGNIAGNLDLGRGSNTLPVTHAGAFTLNQNFKLLACIDVDKSKSKYFAENWNIAYSFNSIDQVLKSNLYFDVISICSPTECHIADINACLPLNPKLFFCEKPISTQVEESSKTKAACDEIGALIAVNYLRRWDKDIIKLKREISSKKRGALRSVIGIYNKGLLNNGSHLIDLLNFLIGKMELKFVGQPNYDFFANDPSICVVLETASGVPILLVPGAEAKDYSIFELQMVFENSMLVMHDGGLRWVDRQVGTSSIFGGYRVLDLGVEKVGDYLSTMSNAVDNIWRAVTKGDSLNSNWDTAITAQTMCEEIFKQAQR